MGESQKSLKLVIIDNDNDNLIKAESYRGRIIISLPAACGAGVGLVLPLTLSLPCSIEPLHLELLRHLQEGVELVRGDEDLPVVHELEDVLDVGELHAGQVDDGVVAVSVLGEDGAQLGAAGSEDHPVCRHLLLSTGQTDVHHLLVVPDITETRGVGDVVPLYQKLFTGSHLSPPGLRLKALVCWVRGGLTVSV